MSKGPRQSSHAGRLFEEKISAITTTEMRQCLQAEEIRNIPA
jgi:hypothetical protein